MSGLGAISCSRLLLVVRARPHGQHFEVTRASSSVRERSCAGLLGSRTAQSEDRPPAALQNSHQNGGRVFLIYVADPITVRWYMNRCQTSVMTILLLAVIKLRKGSPHGGIARESRVDDRPGHTSKRSDGSPAAGDGDGPLPPFQTVGDRGGCSLRLNSLEYEFRHR